ncbi:MAG TPA: cytochrome P450 [Acidimicrobiales bacterium]|nr:cytochrome P450 [Acidimicrobiales bacterium]
MRRGRPDSLPGVDVISHDLYAQRVPHDELARYRREAPVAWLNATAMQDEQPDDGFWLVTRHADLVAVHKDWRTFSSEIGGTELECLAPDALRARRTMLETDPPRHTKLRQLVNPAFSRATVETYAEHTRTVVRAVLDEALASPEVELVHDVARALPIRMLCAVLGLPDEDATQLFEWADAVIYNADPDYSDLISDRDDTSSYRLLPFRSPVSLEVFAYFERLAAARRRHPTGDVIGILADAAVDGAPLTEREKETFFLLLLIAGNETTRHSLSHGLVALLEHPDEMARLRAEPALLTTAVEEILRWTCPQIHFRRTATVDTEVAGVAIAAGERVVTGSLSANYDEAEFPDPLRFDVSRSPNRHVTFGGGGPHLCLGQWLARLEVRVFLEELLPRLGHAELCGPVERVRSNFINGLKRVPIRWSTR